MKSAEIPVMIERLQYIGKRIEAVVGKPYVLQDSIEADDFGQDTSPVNQKPLAVVFPGNASEIRQIVCLANELKVRLWPVSTGKNWGYGAACPIGENYIVLVLERLNKIIAVDEKLAYAVI